VCSVVGHNNNSCEDLPNCTPKPTPTPVALAHFQVYCGEWGNAIDGVGFNPLCKFFNHAQLSCNDALNAMNFYTSGDVSGCGGVRCEGCDGGNVRDWVITELEVNDSQRCVSKIRYWDVEGSEEPPWFSK
jgi:hypothetical protein